MCSLTLGSYKLGFIYEPHEIHMKFHTFTNPFTNLTRSTENSFVNSKFTNWIYELRLVSALRALTKPPSEISSEIQSN